MAAAIVLLRIALPRCKYSESKSKLLQVVCHGARMSCAGWMPESAYDCP